MWTAQRTPRHIAKMFQVASTLVLLSALTTCSKTRSVVITVTGVSDAVQSIRVRAFTSTQAGRPQLLDRNTTRLIIDVPDSAEGIMTVIATGRGQTTCNVSRAEQQVDLSASRLSYPEVELALAPLAGIPESTCTVGIYLDSPAGSVKVKENGKVCSEQSPRDCDIDLTLGNQATLEGTGVPSAYPAFHGACHRVQGCTLLANGGLEVSLSMAPFVSAGSDWYWYNPLPFGLELRAVWGSGADNVWAGGDRGMTLHWDGARWIGVMLPRTNSKVNSIWGSGAGDIWAGTEDGYIYHNNGDRWVDSRNADALSVNGIWGSSGNEVWAVGTYGRISVFRNGFWTDVVNSAGVPPHLLSIWGYAQNGIFAVGEQGRLDKYDGNKWTQGKLTVNGASMSIQDPLTSIAGTGSDDVWISGGHFTVFHFNGQYWQELSRQPTALSTDTWSSIYPLARNRVLVVGQLKYALICDASLPAGSECVQSQWDIDQNRKYSQNGIWGSSASDVWSVGPWGSMLHFDGKKWEDYSNPTGYQWRAVWGSSSTDVYVAGDFGQIQHWDGKSIRRTANGVTQQPMYAISGTSTSDVWIVGNGGQILHTDGNNWSTPQVTNSNDSLLGVWASSPNRVWAIGSNSTAAPSVGVVYNWNGSSWLRQVDAGYTYTSVWAGISDQVWAANVPVPPNSVNIIRRWGTAVTDGSPSSIATGGGRMKSVWGLADQAWAVGLAGAFCHVYSNASSPVCDNPLSMSNINADLNAIWGVSASDLWTVGKANTLVHIVSNSAKPIATLTYTGIDFLSVWSANASDAWVVGTGNTILRYQPQ